MENLEFKVEGSYLTNEARKRYQETADINDGVSFLQSCLIGIPAEYALQVVIGKAKLTGVGVEVYLEEDNEEILPFKLRRPNKPEDVDCGWISPEGFIYGKRDHTSTDDHIQIAEELVEGLVVKKEGLANAYELVEKAGFVKFAPFDIIAGVKAAKITQRQHEAVIKWLEATKRRDSELINLSRHSFTVAEVKKMETLQFGINISVTAL